MQDTIEHGSGASGLPLWSKTCRSRRRSAWAAFVVVVVVAAAVGVGVGIAARNNDRGEGGNESSSSSAIAAERGFAGEGGGGASASASARTNGAGGEEEDVPSGGADVPLPPTDSPTTSSAPSLSRSPSAFPSDAPTQAPSASPSADPSNGPTTSSAPSLSWSPSSFPSDAPTEVPTERPSAHPSNSPTTSSAPSLSWAPSSFPSDAPTDAPSASPSSDPSIGPTTSAAPSSSFSPSALPSYAPTDAPSESPSASPTADPSDVPSAAPSSLPTSVPSSPPSPGKKRRSSVVLAVLPDTQFYSYGAPYIFESQTRWLASSTARDVLGGDDGSEVTTPFVIHLGDMVQFGSNLDQWSAADGAMRVLEDGGLSYGVSVGNHDLINSGSWDTRRDPAAELYLDFFPEDRAASQMTFRGRDSTGFNEYHLITVCGVRLLVLALDWRASSSTLAWARSVLDQNPTVPAVLATHEMLAADSTSSAGSAVRTAYGNYLWDRLVRTHSQIFLAICGHTFGSAHRVDDNDDGEPVLQVLVNYQNGHAGGNGYLRLLELDFVAGTVEAFTFSPFVVDLYEEGGRDDAVLGPDDKTELTEAAHKYTVPFDLRGRFEGIGGADAIPSDLLEGPGASRLDPVRDLVASVPPPPADTTPPPRDVNDYPIVTETLAHWRFHGQTPGLPVPSSAPGGAGGGGVVVVSDESGRGNDLVREESPTGSAPEILTWSSDSHPLSSSPGSVCFSNPTRETGAFLTTIPQSSPLSSEIFPKGYTVEAFVKLAPGSGNDHRWSGVVARRGEGSDADKSENDPNEPLALLDFSPTRELHWGTFPEYMEGLSTAWCAPLESERWYHVAVVNDRSGEGGGGSTRMYVNGQRCRKDPVFDDPRGIATAGMGWTVGSSSYGGRRKVFGGCIGEVRIVGRGLRPDEFLTSRDPTRPLL